MLEQDNFDKVIKEFERQNEAFEREKENVFQDLNIAVSEVEEALADTSQFSKEELVEVEALKQDLEKDLRSKLDNIANPEKTRKNHQDRNLPPWALFCK